MDKKPHILIVDDDNRILKLLKKFLIQNGFLVSASVSASCAAKLLANFIYDLIILDVMMPEITGVDFAREIRKNNIQMPIIMLTALSEPEDRIKGLEAGADDYVTKPFEPRELLLRINNLINAHKRFKKEQETVRFGNNSYNLVTGVFAQNSIDVKLSSADEKILNVLIKAENKVISRDEIAKELGILHLRSIDVQIVRLRNKIEPDPKNPKYLKTIRHQGYVLYT